MNGDDEDPKIHDKEAEGEKPPSDDSRSSPEYPNGSQGEPDFTIGQEEAGHLSAMEKGFLLRPRISIRLRIVAGFLLCFFLLATTGLINLAILYQARGKLHFLDFSQDLSRNVQDARQLARTDFPNHNNLKASREHAKKALDMLTSEGVNILDIAGEKELVTLSYEFGHYVQMIDQAVELSSFQSPDPVAMHTISDEMDTQSGQIMDRLRMLTGREAAGVNHVLRRSQELPFIFGGVMLLIIFWITKLLASTITEALNRMEQSTQRIIAGDYTLMTPRRGYRDELSDLALAVNHMLLELRAREAQVLKADKLASVGALTTGVAQQVSGVFNAVETRVATFRGEHTEYERCVTCGALEGVLAESQRGHEAIAALLEFARDDEGAPEQVNLADLVESARLIVQHLMTSASVTFHAELPDDVTLVRGTAGQLKQVFVNLFHNAVQAMPWGGALTLRVGFLGGDRIDVTVADQGVGIPREDLPHIFDPFYTPGERAKVSGPGLSVSYGIVKKLGGDIQVKSVVGMGTTFHITLPLAE